MHVAVGWQLGIDPLEKFQKLLMPMTPMTLPDHFPGRDVQGREQRSRAVPDVVMRLAGRDARAHWQERPRPVQGLDLAFLVHRQDDRAIRRKEIQADDVALATDFWCW